MAYPVASGVPDLSGIVIPELWASDFNVKFYETTVLAHISQTDYQGMLQKQGDTVNIPTIPTPTIRDYVKGQELIDEHLEPGMVTLLVDQGKYFSCAVDDVDAKQSNVDLLGKWNEAASSQMKVVIDKAVLAGISTAAASDNQGATAGKSSGNIDLGASTAAIPINTTNVIQKITDLALVLDEQNIPDEGRWMVIPPWFRNKLVNSELRNASDMGDPKSALRTGFIGMIDRFNIYVSNNMTSVSDTYDCWYVLAGHKVALTFASQMTKFRIVYPTNRFEGVAQGLQIYGYEVVNDTALAALYCRPAA